MNKAVLRVHQFKKEGCLSSVLYRQDTKRAVVVDPARGLLDEIQAFLSESGLAFDRHVQLCGCAEHQGVEFWGRPEHLNGCYHLLGSPSVLFQAEPPGVGELPTDFPPETLIFPSHAEEGILFSTLKIEKERGSTAVSPLPMSAEKFSRKLTASSGALFIDVREDAEFSRGHIAGSRNLPLSELAFSLGALSGARQLYLSCLTGKRSACAAQTLARFGYETFYLSGGYQGWVQSGYSIVSNS